MENETQENASITGTHLGFEDHGALTFVIQLKFASGGCGFGCLSIGDPFGNALRRILGVVGVSTWEELRGKYVRTRHQGLGGRVVAIGHLIEDKWVTVDELGALLRGES